VELRHCHVTLVDDQQPVVGEVVEQGVRRLAGRTPVQVTPVVLDPIAAADSASISRSCSVAHPQPLGFEQLARLVKLAQALAELDLDRGDRATRALVPGDVVGGGKTISSSI